MNTIIFHHLKKLDWTLIISSLFLAGIGLLSIYSSSIGREDFLNLKKQLIFMGLGIFLMFLFSFFDYRSIRSDPYLILFLYLASLGLLAGLFFLAPEVRGTKSWYKIGLVSFDPIEVTKLILIIILAKYFSMRHIEAYRIRHIFLSGAYITIPSLLVFFQPNLGSALIIIILWISILLISGIKIRHFLIICLIGVLISGFSWAFFLKDYQKERILSFVSPESEPLGAGWSHHQAKIAIGSGGVFGKGVGNGSQTQLGFLPEPQTDFIFSAIAEEFGLVGISVILLLFLILIWRIIKIAVLSETNFPRLFATGFAIVLVSQIVINIGMNLGLLPIIGIALPLVSYGGSSLIITYIGFGILQSIKVNG